MPILASHSLRAIDVETTGLFAGGHRVLEVASVRIEDGVVEGGWSSLVRPDRPIPAGATAVHGITAAMVRDAPTAGAVAASLAAEIGDRPLVFHHARFDLPFLEALMREGGQPPPRQPVIDTLGLARGIEPRGGHSLGRLARRYGIPPRERHRALSDATTTALLLIALAARWERERGVRSLMELAALSQDALRRATSSGLNPSAPRDPVWWDRRRPAG
jgi:DNA polymerase III epsilon subunit family exonuclease